MWKREQISLIVLRKKLLQKLIMFDPLSKHNFLQTLQSNFNYLVIDYTTNCKDIISYRKSIHI